MGAGVPQEETTMICVICKTGEIEPGTTTVTLARDAAILVVRDVPDRVCANCGEEYLNEDIAARLLQTAEEAVQTGVQMEVRRYQAA